MNSAAPLDQTLNSVGQRGLVPLTPAGQAPPWDSYPRAVPQLASKDTDIFLNNIYFGLYLYIIVI